MTREELQFKKMTQTNTKRLVVTLGVPTIISMLVTAIYNIADTFFVSQLGKSASGAVGVVFSLMAIVQAIGFTFGMGSGSLISSKLGEKKDEEAQKIGSSAFYGALLLGVIFSIICFCFFDSILKMLGATDTVLPYARSYASYIIAGFPVMIASFVMNNILRAEGKSKLSMIGLTAGGILNIILDPIFITIFNLGISGAAIATLISQTVSMLILLSMFVFRKSIIKLSVKEISKDISVYLDVIKVGLPSLCRQGLASIASILLNRQAGAYGSDAALSAMSIVSKVFMVIFSISLGIGQGYQPVCGYNYFAKKYDRVKEAMVFTFICGTVTMTTMCIIFSIFAKQTIGFFINDEEVISIGAQALRFQCFSLPFLSLNVICNMTYQSIRHKYKATLLSSCRQGIFFIPLVFILPSMLELVGVELVQAMSDFLTFVISVPFFIMILKDLNNKISENTKKANVDLEYTLE